MQVFNEDMLLPVARATRLLAQQCDAVAALAALARAVLDDAGNQLFGGGDRLGTGTVRFDNQNVPIRQRIELARVHEAGGDRLDLKASRNGGDRKSTRLNSSH